MYQPRSRLHTFRAGLFLLGALWALNSQAEPARCPEWAAQLVSKEGRVQWREEHSDQWQDAPLHSHFCAGDSIHVLTHRAALRLANDTLVRLDAHTTLQLFPESPGLWVRLLEGAGHFLSRTPRSFEVRTPYLNASIDGTEFIVNASTEGDFVTVVEGAVTVHNPQGRLQALAGDQVRVEAGQMPVVTHHIRLQDAAQWTLYFPPLIVSAPALPKVQELLDQEAYAEAYARLLVEGDTSPHQQALAASIALVLGQPETAEAHLQSALALEPEQPDALAVTALQDLVAGNRAIALAQSQSLVDSYPHNLSVLLAHSYTLQGDAQLSAAQNTIEQALTLHPNNLTLLARATELALSVGDSRSARRYIQQGLAQAPNHSELHTLAGFSALNRFATHAALEHFQQALSRRNNLPLAHLGLALSLIQDHQPERAREHMELAALLDPGNSLLRSYLGKTYLQQTQDLWAEEQYHLAQQLDPNDPTPWFYLAHLRWQQNRTPEALRLVTTAIEKNDQRAIYRSRLLLDSDAAARSAGLTGIYQDLGFNQTAQHVAARSLARSPLDFAAHQAVSNAYAQEPDRQTLRVSETLQAALLAPIGIHQPSLISSLTSLPLYQWTQPSQMGMGEYGALFNQQGLSGQIDTLTGSQQTRGLTAQLQATGRDTQIGASHLRLDTDGYRPNNDLSANIGEINLHRQVTERTKIFVQALELEESKGDLLNGINSEYFDENIRFDRNLSRYNFGMAWQLSPRMALLANTARTSSDDIQTAINVPIDNIDQIQLSGTLTTYHNDISWLSHHEKWSYQIGYREEEHSAQSDTTITFDAPIDPDVDQGEPHKSTFKRGYANLSIAPQQHLRYFIGLGYVHQKHRLQQFSDSRWDHKLGLIWNPIPQLSFTAAQWQHSAENSALSGNLEPTHIFNIPAASNQKSFAQQDIRHINVAWKGANLAVLLSAERNKSKSYLFLESQENFALTEKVNTDALSAELSYLATNRLSFFTIINSYQSKKPQHSTIFAANYPALDQTIQRKLGITHLTSENTTLILEVDSIKQEIAYSESIDSDTPDIFHPISENEVTANIKLHFHLASKRVNLKLEAYNIMDREISIYQGPISGFSESYLPSRPALSPRRSIMIRASFSL